MDDHRFDNLVKALAATSRRRAARLLVAGLLGTIALPAREATAACIKLGRRCGRGKRCCAGTACRSGRCRCAARVPCAGRCCGAGQGCEDGRCACVPEARTTTCGQDSCGVKRNNCGQNVDCNACFCEPEHPNTTCGQRRCGVKPNNCGEDVDCGDCDPPSTNRHCDASGTCVCNDSTQECGGFCADTSIDFNNCGGCSRSCERNERCTDGRCFSLYCPAVTECSASGSPACDLNKTGTCLCMKAVDGGTYCGHPDPFMILPCTSNPDCRSEFGPGAGCVHHPDRCGRDTICVRVCDVAS